MTAISPETTSRVARPLDPGGEVPAEYDVFCEACGYSLLGIAADRCPECGAPYDPNELPFARIPWLHRRRIGRVRAYAATVWGVLRRPRRFAEELCRPVRVSAADARAFRALTIRIAAFAVAVAAAGIMTIIIANDPGGAALLPPRWWAAMAGFVALAFVSTTAFLRLATDMPTFIWRGPPGRPAGELAPVHLYASAPLALMPLFALVALSASTVLLDRGADPGRHRASQLAIGASALLLLFVSWRCALQLMTGATGGAERRQVRWLGFYLPVHWLATAFVVSMLAGAVVLGVNLAAETWGA
jgi:hypothetical protein